jgi:hypothetical protein
MGAWILFALIEYLVYKNGHYQGIYGLICILIAGGFLYLLNLINVWFYNNYIKEDGQFKKWIKKDDNYSTTIIVLTFSTVFTFKLFRILYSRLFEKSKFQLLLTSTNSLKPINILSILSVFL